MAPAKEAWLLVDEKVPRPRPPSIMEKPHEIGERLREILREEHREPKPEKPSKSEELF